MAQQPQEQKCNFCVEEMPIHGQISIQRFGEKAFKHELRLCPICFDTLSRMLCDLMRNILAREIAKLRQQRV